jgi:hypothetical protein
MGPYCVLAPLMVQDEPRPSFLIERAPRVARPRARVIETQSSRPAASWRIQEAREAHHELVAPSQWMALASSGGVLPPQ